MKPYAYLVVSEDNHDHVLYTEAEKHFLARWVERPGARIYRLVEDTDRLIAESAGVVQPLPNPDVLHQIRRKK